MAHMKQMCISMSLGFRNNGSHRGQKIGMYKQFHHRFSLNFVSQSKTHLDVLLYFNIIQLILPSKDLINQLPSF